MTWGLWGIGVPGPGERTAGANGDLPEGMIITRKDYPRYGESSWHAHHNGQEIGSLYVMPSDYSDKGAVGDINVHDDYLRRGVGTALWEAAGRPLHTPGQQTGKGKAWAQAVGGDNDFNVAWNPDDDVYDPSDYDEDYDDGDSPFYTSSHRTAMPAPAPDNLNFKYHSDNSTIPRGHALPDAPVVTAHLGDDPNPIGHLEWFYNDDYDYGDTPEEDLAGHGEVRYIHVKPEHQHQNVATKMFDWTKQNVIPELHHSDELTDDGRGWRDYEQTRNKKARIMSAAVTVYTQPNCIQCTMTKKQLDKLGIAHDTVDVSADPEAHAYVRGLGYTAAPVVVVNDGEEHWAGFKPDRLKALSGE